MVQELLEGEGDTPAIVALSDNLETHEALHGEWEDFDSSVGLLYRKDRFQLVESKSLFSPNWYAFPRPPLFVTLKDTASDGVEVGFIVIHLKSYEEDGSDLPRRQEACDILNTFIQAQGDTLLLMGGDFNDNPYDPPAVNIFDGLFLGEEVPYEFLTYPLGPEAFTFAGFINGDWTGLFLDHVIVNQPFAEAAGPSATEVYPIGLFEMDSWNDDHSDHLPVSSIFSGSQNPQ